MFKLILITMILMFGSVSGYSSDKKEKLELDKDVLQLLRELDLGDVEGNGQLIVSMKTGQKVPYEVAMRSDSERYLSLLELPNGDGTNERRKKFDKNYKLSFLKWIKIIEKHSKTLAKELKDLAIKTNFYYVNKNIHFPYKQYPSSDLPVEYSDVFAAAIYYKNEVYISIPAMNKITAFDGLTKEELQGYVLIHEMINVMFNHIAKDLQSSMSSCVSKLKEDSTDDLQRVINFKECTRPYKEEYRALEIRKLRLGGFILDLVANEDTKFDFHLNLMTEGYPYWKETDINLKKDLFKRLREYKKLGTWTADWRNNRYSMYQRIFIDHVVDELPLTIDSKMFSSYPRSKYFSKIIGMMKEFGMTPEEITSVGFISYETFETLVKNLRSSFIWNNLDYLHSEFDNAKRERGALDEALFQPFIKYYHRYMKENEGDECSATNAKILGKIVTSDDDMEKLYSRVGLYKKFEKIYYCAKYSEYISEKQLKFSKALHNREEQSSIAELLSMYILMKDRSVPEMVKPNIAKKIVMTGNSIKKRCKKIYGKTCSLSVVKEFKLKKGDKFSFIVFDEGDFEDKVQPIKNGKVNFAATLAGILEEEVYRLDYSDSKPKLFEIYNGKERKIDLDEIFYSDGDSRGKYNFIMFEE